MKQARNGFIKTLPYLCLVGVSALGLMTIVATGGVGGGDGGGISNSAPVADAGHDMNATIDSLVILDGSGSTDADGDTLTYSWSFTSVPIGSTAVLSDPTVVSPTFTTDVVGTYMIRLVVNDGTEDSTEDTVTITALTAVSNLLDTGQINCYNNSEQIAWPRPGEAFYGQDAQYSTNPMIFSDNGTTVTDNVTGLTWQKEDDGIQYNWYEASGTYDATYNPGSTDVCGSLILDAYSDWRLPTRRELMSIVNYGTLSPAIDITYFPNTSSANYWSSTTWAGSGDVAWAVDFTSGRVTYGFGDKASGLCVRCVRGPSWGGNDFVDNGNGTVTDNITGLIWQQEDDGIVRRWEGALSYCENLVLAGSSDWRLPDIKELESIVDYTTSVPTIDTTYFPTTKSFDYWSSTTKLGNSDHPYAWVVDFTIGWIDYDSDKDSRLVYVRCVR